MELRRQLDQIEASIVPANSGKRDWAEEEFAAAIADKLKRLDNDIARGRADWNSVTACERAYKPLFREALAFLQVRGRDKLDLGGPARLTQALVSELSQACSLGRPIIAPDVDNSFTEFVQIIRLRFPPVGIWDVPVAAHEFGHFAAYRLTASPDDGLRRPQAFSEFVTQYLAENNKNLDAEKKKWTFWLNEFFADMFATYVLGPGFAASSLLLRFDIVLAYSEDDPLHPSYADRAAAILYTLQRMDLESKGQFNKALAWLTKQWEGLLCFAATPHELAPARELARQLYPVVRKLAPHAQYTNWDFAVKELRFVVGPPYKDPQREFSPRDLLNAAWLAHSYDADAAALSARALQLWEAATAEREPGK